jgi:hypothetical protein
MARLSLQGRGASRLKHNGTNCDLRRRASPQRHRAGRKTIRIVQDDLRQNWAEFEFKNFFIALLWQSL